MPNVHFIEQLTAFLEKIGRISEEVILQLIKSKCIPVLLHGLEVCALNKLSKIASLDFVTNRFFMKLFQTNNIEIVRACQEFFGFELPSALLPKRVKEFENRFCNRSELIV